MISLSIIQAYAPRSMRILLRCLVFVIVIFHILSFGYAVGSQGDVAANNNEEGAHYNLSYPCFALIGQNNIEAVRCFEKVIEKDPKSKYGWSGKAIALTHKKDYKKALYCINEAIEIDPNDFLIFAIKGNILFRMGEYDSALEHLNKSIEIEPKYFQAWARKGDIYFYQNNYNWAIKCFNRVLELNPKNKNAFLKKGLSLMRMGDFDDAIACFDNVLIIDPKDEYAWIAKGNILLFNLDDSAEAFYCFDVLTEIDPQNKNYWLKKAECLYNMRDLDASLKCIDKSIHIDSYFIEAMSLRYRVLDELGIEDQYIMTIHNLDQNWSYSEINKYKNLFLHNTGFIDRQIKYFDIDLSGNNSKSSITDNLTTKKLMSEAQISHLILDFNRNITKYFPEIKNLSIDDFLVINKNIKSFKKIEAAEILDKIRRGEVVEYDHVIIDGDLDLGLLDLPRESTHEKDTMKWIEKNGVIIAALRIPDKYMYMCSLIRINDSIVQGNFIFNNLIFNKSVNFKNTTFMKSCDFSNSQFKGYAVFTETNFSDHANFEGSEFFEDALFRGANFNGGTSFDMAQFHKDAYYAYSTLKTERDIIINEFFSSDDSIGFKGCQFSGDAIFVGCNAQVPLSFKASNFTWARFFGGTFLKSISFEGVNISNIADFRLANFKNDVNFKDAVLGNEAWFDGAKFAEYIDFSNALFYNVTFLGSMFNGPAGFMGSHFNGSTEFDFSIFSNITNFGDAYFMGDVSFNNSQLNEEARFYNSHFYENLYLMRTKYDKLFIKYSNIEHLRCDGDAFQLLIENFKKIGYFEDADNCYYQFRVEQFNRQNHLENIPRSLFDFFAWIFFGFGVRPEYTLIWSFFIIIASGLLFFYSNGIRNSGNASSVIYSPIYLKVQRSLKQRVSSFITSIKTSIYSKKDLSLLESLLFSATNFTFGGNIIPLFPPDEFVIIGKARYVVVLERILGWLFLALFAISLARTIIR